MPDKDPLRAIAETILECEQLALAAAIPACVLRLGYLYGPASRDLRAYRTAFRLGRPYWAGPRDAPQYHIHEHDARSALLAAAAARCAGRVFYATDARPAPFMAFMDHFAQLVGRRRPLHLPAVSRPLVRFIVREEHMQQVALAMPARAPLPRVPGWKPAFPDYRTGLADVIAAWGR